MLALETKQQFHLKQLGWILRNQLDGPVCCCCLCASLRLHLCPSLFDFLLISLVLIVSAQS